MIDLLDQLFSCWQGWWRICSQLASSSCSHFYILLLHRFGFYESSYICYHIYRILFPWCHFLNIHLKDRHHPEGFELYIRLPNFYEIADFISRSTWFFQAWLRLCSSSLFLVHIACSLLCFREIDYQLRLIYFHHCFLSLALDSKNQSWNDRSYRIHYCYLSHI